MRYQKRHPPTYRPEFIAPIENFGRRVDGYGGWSENTEVLQLYGVMSQDGRLISRQSVVVKELSIFSFPEETLKGPKIFNAQYETYRRLV